MKNYRIRVDIYRTENGQLRGEIKTENRNIGIGTPKDVESDGYWGEEKWLKKELLGYIANLDTEYIVKELES